ncbi:DNA helicase rad5 [Basidiobolus ranarum]|uniref:DNA helicase rad5 n=1 Tax=Basidiobolus ranarum TaxID=34480 RepID=A0ABR2WSP7_9FUNG
MHSEGSSNELSKSLTSILGSEVVSKLDLGNLWNEANGDLNLAINKYFECPDIYKKLEKDVKLSEKAKLDSTVPLKRKQSIPSSPRKKPVREDKWPKYIGDMILVAFSMTKGKNIFKEGETVNIERAKPTVAKARNSKKKFNFGSNAAKNSQNTIVRLTIGGREVGKLPSDTSKFISKLFDLGICYMVGKIISAPEDVRMMDDVIMQLKIYLTKEVLSAPTVSAMTDDDEDSLLKERKFAMLSLFKAISLHPVTSNSSAKNTTLDYDGLIGNIEPPASKDITSTDENENDEDEEKQISETEMNLLYEKAQKADVRLEEMEPSAGMTVELRGYQKQALSWMTSKENSYADNKTLSLLWHTYIFPCENEDSTPGEEQRFYLNPYTGELSLDLPTLDQTYRGGILADEMGLGKTLETLSLIHTNRYIESDESSIESIKTTPHNFFDLSKSDKDSTNSLNKARLPFTPATLVVCPMSLLSQWRDEILHAFEPGTLRVKVYYGGDRAKDIGELCSDTDVVLTTYGTLSV